MVNLRVQDLMNQINGLVKALLEENQALNQKIRFYTNIKSPLLRNVVNLVSGILPERYLLSGFTKLLREEL